MARKPDKITVESVKGTFDLFTRLKLTNDLTQASELQFQAGDDASWTSLRPLVAHGKSFKVYLNDRLRMTGRVYVREVPVDSGGSTLTVTIRSLMSDAYYASAAPTITVQNTSLKVFLLKLYEPLGFRESDFVFQADLDVALMTGKKIKGGKNPRFVEGITLDQAKVQIPETIYEAAARHLKRHGLAHWGTPDGKIYVGPYDDRQYPLYRFLCRRTNTQNNNVISIAKNEDWSSVPSSLTVYGFGSAQSVDKTKVSSRITWPDVEAAGFYRPVYIQNTNLKSKEHADRQALQERAARSREKDAYDVIVDGWSYWNGSEKVPYAPNTTADLDVANLGGGQGRYYVYKTSMTLDAKGGATTALSLVAPGIFDLG